MEEFRDLFPWAEAHGNLLGVIGLVLLIAAMLVGLAQAVGRRR